MRYGKKEFLELILTLAGCQDIKVDFERVDNGFEYTVEGNNNNIKKALHTHIEQQYSHLN
jgi:hypothetical protein